MICPICSQELKSKLTEWSFYCDSCDYWGSSLKPVTHVLEKDAFLTKRETTGNPIECLDKSRLDNFNIELKIIAACQQAAAPTMLEVGCGAGLFLEQASSFGFTSAGIEAYETMARAGLEKGQNIRIGLFPDCLGAQERFRVIVFNDVFEHLPDAARILRVCRGPPSARRPSIH